MPSAVPVEDVSSSPVFIWVGLSDSSGRAGVSRHRCEEYGCAGWDTFRQGEPGEGRAGDKIYSRLREARVDLWAGEGRPEQGCSYCTGARVDGAWRRKWPEATWF